MSAIQPGRPQERAGRQQIFMAGVSAGGQRD